LSQLQKSNWLPVVKNLISGHKTSFYDHFTTIRPF
jgi:hypothetical protein